MYLTCLTGPLLGGRLTTRCNSPCRSATCTPTPPWNKMVKLLCCLSSYFVATPALFVTDTPAQDRDKNLTK